MGVVAVDPTSPFTGGAILGDRIRMQDHALDPGVFIRSLATRGHLGGLSRSTSDVVQVLDAMGKDVVIVETVGVGQDEIEVASLAHTVVVVSVPGLGDDVQAIKAGVLEIADVFAVNKADREGADRTVRDLQMMLELRRTVTARPREHDAVHRFSGGEAPSAGPAEPPTGSRPSCGPSPSGTRGSPSSSDAIDAHRAHLEAHRAEARARERPGPRRLRGAAARAAPRRRARAARERDGPARRRRRADRRARGRSLRARRRARGAAASVRRGGAA